MLDYLDRAGHPLTAEQWVEKGGDSEYIQVAVSHRQDVILSTIWIGMGSVNDEPHKPSIFESTVIGGARSGEYRVYSTEPDAREGHEALCVELFAGTQASHDIPPPPPIDAVTPEFTPVFVPTEPVAHLDAEDIEQAAKFMAEAAGLAPSEDVAGAPPFMTDVADRAPEWADEPPPVFAETHVPDAGPVLYDDTGLPTEEPTAETAGEPPVEEPAAAPETSLDLSDEPQADLASDFETQDAEVAPAPAVDAEFVDHEEEHPVETASPLPTDEVIAETEQTDSNERRIAPVWARPTDLEKYPNVG